MSTMTRAFERAATTHTPACAADPELMFPVQESERAGERTAGEARALEVCAVCPLLAECRRAVLGVGTTPPLAYGVAGGLTREDRRAVRAADGRFVCGSATDAAMADAAVRFSASTPALDGEAA